MLVRFNQRKVVELIDGRKIIFNLGDTAELPVHEVRHLLNRGIVQEVKEAPVTPETPKMETATLPNTKETATKPKPEGKPTPPKAAQPKAE